MNLKTFLFAFLTTTATATWHTKNPCKASLTAPLEQVLADSKVCDDLCEKDFGVYGRCTTGTGDRGSPRSPGGRYVMVGCCCMDMHYCA